MLNKNIKRKSKEIENNIENMKLAGAFVKNQLQIIIKKQQTTIKRWTELRRKLLFTKRKKIQYKAKKRHIKLTAHNWLIHF